MNQSRILLIQDNIQTARHLSELLRELGYCVEWQSSDETAIASVQAVPDLIILDTQFLDDEELRIFQVLRKHDGWTDVPILLIATILNSESRDRLRLLDADEIVTKPIDSAELVVKVQSTLRRHLYAAKAALDLRDRRDSYSGLFAVRGGGPWDDLKTVAATQASPQSIETILVQLLRQARRAIPFDVGIVCVEVEPGRYGLLACVGDRRFATVHFYETGESYTGWIALHKEALLVRDIDKETRAKPLGRDRGLNPNIKSFIGLPLVASDSVIGTLEFASSQRGTYDEASLEVLRPVAEIARLALKKAFARQELEQYLDTLWAEFSRERRPAFPVYESEALRRVMRMADKIKNTQCSILITGETGTGKELVAQYIHSASTRRHLPFVDVNCAAVPETLQETELFGIEKGVATGVERRTGKFELCGGGTLFLDELGYMPANMQAKMLRVLQERTFERVGGHPKLQFLGRVVSATSSDLVAAMQDGKFLSELYYRLAVIHISVPPLRERREDIPVLTRHFVRRFCAEQSRPVLSISAETMKSFIVRDWPGNVRELRNAVERTVILSSGDELEAYQGEVSTPSAHSEASSAALLLKLAFQAGWSIPEIEGRYSNFVYEQLNHNKARACRLLKINYRTLRNHVHAGEQQEVG